MANPLDRFVSVEFTNGFKVDSMPKLGEFIKAHGFARGIEMYDQAIEDFRMKLEKSIQERLQPKDPPKTSKLVESTQSLRSNAAATASTVVVTPPATPTAPALGGVGGEDIGGVGGETMGPVI